MNPVERLFSEPPGPTVVSCDWCGDPAIVCTAVEQHVGGAPMRIGLCEEHHAQLSSATGPGVAGEARADYERRRSERDVELRRQRSAWQRRKAAHRSGARERMTADADRPAGPQDSEELVAAVLQGERPVSPVQVVDPRLEDPARTIERLQAALWPLVQLAEQSGIFVDCNPSQTHSVLVVGEVPVQALFNARDLLKRER